MAICIQSMIVIKGKNTGKVLATADRKIFKKFDNYHDFGFDVYDPKNWRKFLNNMKFNGKLLPRKNADDFKIAYRVYFFGMPKGFPKHTAKGNYYNLFPGYAESGESLRPSHSGFLD